MSSAAGHLLPPSSVKQTMSSPPSPTPRPRKANISPAPSLISLCSVMDAPVNVKLRYKDVAKYLIWAECPLDDSSAAMHNKGYVDFISTSPTNPKTSSNTIPHSGFKFLPSRRPSGSASSNKASSSKVCAIS